MNSITTTQLEELRTAVERAKVAGRDHFEMVVPRGRTNKTMTRPPERIRMFGRAGPHSSEDKPVIVEGTTMRAQWRVCDCEIFLRQVAAKRR